MLVPILQLSVQFLSAELIVNIEISPRNRKTEWVHPLQATDPMRATKLGRHPTSLFNASDSGGVLGPLQQLGWGRRSKCFTGGIHHSPLLSPCLVNILLDQSQELDGIWFDFKQCVCVCACVLYLLNWNFTLFLFKAE